MGGNATRNNTQTGRQKYKRGNKGKTSQEQTSEIKKRKIKKGKQKKPRKGTTEGKAKNAPRELNDARINYNGKGRITPRDNMQKMRERQEKYDKNLCDKTTHPRSKKTNKKTSMGENIYNTS